MQPGDHGTTFGGGPFLSTVALHVYERLSDPAMLKTVRERGRQMKQGLDALARSTAKVRAVRGIGLMWGVDVSEPAKEIVSRALNAGLLICSAGEHTLRLLPPLVVGKADVERGLALLTQAIG
jgi:acetylornithine/N-succinyldiaminopimelate aminotransferase